MSRPIPGIIVSLLVLLLVACGGGGSSGGSKKRQDSGERMPLVLAAGSVRLEPAADDGWADDLDLKHLDVERVDAVYDVSTPSNEPFEFDVLTRGEENTGWVGIAVGHVSDDGTTPEEDDSLAGAGVVTSGSGTGRVGAWLESHGDGFARVTMRGAVTREQIIAIQSKGEEGPTTAVVRVRIGEESEVNVAATEPDDHPRILEETTLYSSDSWLFGLPTVSVSGDRTTIVCYEGDRARSGHSQRYEMRLQFDAATQTVTGGGSEETSPDTGHWRDHEIAALYNVLALVHSGDDAVELRLSFDRGATMAQTESFPTNGSFSRLAQVSMALDYSLAVVYWRGGDGARSQLVLVEGKPDAFDGGGSPTSFAFAPPVVIHATTGDVTPLLHSTVWSEGGDLVLGYAYSSFTSRPGGTWESRTENRCAVRLYGGEVEDHLVEVDVVVGRDPSVSVVGSGESMRIFYAYEGRRGVLLRTSDDGGATFSDPVRVPDDRSHTPTVFARLRAQGTVVDLLYLTTGRQGREIHELHWDDFDATVPTQHRLTEATMSDSAWNPPGVPVPGGDPGGILPDEGWRVTEVAWFGYDAVIEGDEIVVVYDEETYDAGIWFLDEREFLGPPVPSTNAGQDSGFVPADPPPLAPGLTEPVPAPDPDHMHQLKMLRLE